ncbi:MAG: hypothetical protein ACI4JW_07410 [Oscillospiraceae bacterium]
MLGLRRFLAFLCYTAMLAADAASVYVIYQSITGGMTYYLGLLIFVPVFIFSYWMSTFFSQLTDGKVNGRRVCPKWLRSFLNALGTLISFALVAFWGYICITQSLQEAPNENLLNCGNIITLRQA